MYFPYSIDADLDVFGEADGRLGDILQDKATAALRIDRARREADGSINSRLAVCYDTPFKVELTGTWDVDAGTKDVTGTGSTATSELRAGQIVTLGDETREVDKVTSDTAFVLLTDHAGGAVSGIATVTPSELDAVVRRWSYILTIDRLLPGATAGSESLKNAIDDVRAEMKDACEGRFNLPGVEKTDSRAGFVFVPMPEDVLPDPAGDLTAVFRSRNRFDRHDHLGT